MPFATSRTRMQGPESTRIPTLMKLCMICITNGPISDLTWGAMNMCMPESLVDAIRDFRDKRVSERRLTKRSIYKMHYKIHLAKFETAYHEGDIIFRKAHRTEVCRNIIVNTEGNPEATQKCEKMLQKGLDKARHIQMLLSYEPSDDVLGGIVLHETRTMKERSMDPIMIYRGSKIQQMGIPPPLKKFKTDK